MRFFSFFRSAVDYIIPDPDAIDRAGESASKHSTYHRRIVLVSAVFGAIGMVIGITFSIFFADEPKTGKDQNMILLFPVMGCVVGLLFGVAAACLFAPREFLTGPVGLKWTRLIGTENVVVARLVCLIVGLLFSVGIVAVFWLGVTKK